MTPFYRLSGGGNDFLALLEPADQPTVEEIRSWCRRGLSAGADGVFVLSRQSDRIRMTYFNADGRPAALCLNGTRCAVRLAAHMGWLEGACVIETGAGSIAGRLVGPNSVSLTLPRPGPPSSQDLVTPAGDFSGWKLQVGVPHFVVPWEESLSTLPISQVGPLLRSHPDLGPPGANIDFVRYGDRHRIEIRSFERGVEAETLACGTGVMASVAVGLELELLDLPVRATTLGGFDMQVERVDSQEAPEEWLLVGDARVIANGFLLPGATDLPPAPSWS